MNTGTPHPHPSGPQRPDCWKCAHFMVSWDPAKPYACRLMGFKSKVLPAIEVFRTDGNPCRGFTAKPDLAPVVQDSPSMSSAAVVSKIKPRPHSTHVWEA